MLLVAPAPTARRLALVAAPASSGNRHPNRQCRSRAATTAIRRFAAAAALPLSLLEKQNGRQVRPPQPGKEMLLLFSQLNVCLWWRTGAHPRVAFSLNHSVTCGISPLNHCLHCVVCSKVSGAKRAFLPIGCSPHFLFSFCRRCYS